METEELALRITEVAARDVEETRALVEAVTNDQIVALARGLCAFMPAKVSTGPQGVEVFMKLLTAAMQSAAVELELTQLAVQIHPVGMKEPTRVRVCVIPEELTFRTAKSQPIGGDRIKVRHGG